MRTKRSHCMSGCCGRQSSCRVSVSARIGKSERFRLSTERYVGQGVCGGSARCVCFDSGDWQGA